MNRASTTLWYDLSSMTRSMSLSLPGTEVVGKWIRFPSLPSGRGLDLHLRELHMQIAIMEISHHCHFALTLTLFSRDIDAAVSYCLFTTTIHAQCRANFLRFCTR